MASIEQQLNAYLPQDRPNPNTLAGLAAISGMTNPQAGGMIGGPSEAYGNQAGAPAVMGQGSGVMMPSFDFGQQEVAPQQLVQQRAAMEAKNRQDRLNLQKMLAAVTPAPGREAINSNFYKGVGLDTDIFNSASGPYGQLQQAAVLTAKPRADRAIASLTSQAQERMNAQDNATKAQIARAIAGAISGGSGQGELGQNANDFQRYSPLYDPRLRRPRPQGVFAGVQ